VIGHILFSRSCSAIHDPRYYQRFGFSTVLARHLQAPYSGDAFMALALRPGALGGQSGRVVYPAAFALVD
jgi:putative acetyltransferase